MSMRARERPSEKFHRPYHQAFRESGRGLGWAGGMMWRLLGMAWDYERYKGHGKEG